MTERNDSPQRMPALFVGHGNPMHAIQENDYTRTWKALGRRLPRPAAIVVISAHWYVSGTMVTAMEQPRTIHDFGGFPRELFAVEYPAPGSPSLASRVQFLLAESVDVLLDHQWGLDHGAWSVLKHLFPNPDIPVVQLSIDESRPALFHYELGKRLAPLRDEGVLILGSGNLIHNLHAYGWGRHVPEPFDWATRFEEKARRLMLEGDHDPLIEYESLGQDATLAAPTPEHYLPLLYVLGTQQAADTVSFPVEGVDGGSVSMLSVEIGSGSR